MELRDFYNSRSGACLLVGNGANLRLTPPETFDLPAFGMNTIHKYEGWAPDYYVTVDNRVMREFGGGIVEKYRDIPKFIPWPDLDMWNGPNFHRFYHRAGPIWREPLTADSMSTPGITYSNVMHAAIQIAVFIGFTKLLIIGMEHKNDGWRNHFWGRDDGMPSEPPQARWFSDYKTLVDRLGVEIINISVDTFVPETIIPRGDWRQYASQNV